MADTVTGVEGERIGGFLVTIGAMTPVQVCRVLDAQRDGDARIFSEIAISHGYIDDDALQRYVDVHAPAARA